MNMTNISNDYNNHINSSNHSNPFPNSSKRIQDYSRSKSLSNSEQHTLSELIGDSTENENAVLSFLKSGKNLEKLAIYSIFNIKQPGAILYYIVNSFIKSKLHD